MADQSSQYQQTETDALAKKMAVGVYKIRPLALQVMAGIVPQSGARLMGILLRGNSSQLVLFRLWRGNILKHTKIFGEE